MRLTATRNTAALHPCVILHRHNDLRIWRFMRLLCRELHLQAVSRRHDAMIQAREERRAKQAPSLRRKRYNARFRFWFTTGEIMEPCRARSYGTACAIVRKAYGKTWRQELDRIERITGEER